MTPIALGAQGGVLLTDTGPLVAITDRKDSNHARALAVLQSLPGQPLLTVWPCMTEAIYLLQREGGYPAQAKLLRFLEAGAVRIWNPDTEQAPRLEARIIELMATYQDIPCDFADAALVAVAELTDAPRIFTFDSHFYAYRTRSGAALEVVPA